MTSELINNENLRLGRAAGKVFAPALAVGVIGLIASAALYPTTEPGAFWRSYLLGFMFVTSIALGALIFTAIQHMTRAGWSVVLRRLSEAIAANLAWLWVLFLPLLVLMVMGNGDVLYHWADVEHRDAILQAKAPYLNAPFWTIRAVFFLAVWAATSTFFFRNSVRQDDTGDVSLTHRMQRLAPAIIVLYALTQSFAAVDWIKSVEAHWFSTMFGVYFFAASMTGFFAVLCITMFLVNRAGRATREITLEHYQDAGKFLFGFGVVFWAYIAFSQYMLIWYGNIPEETTWFMARQVDGWLPLSIVLVLGHFAIPFVLLISKYPKRMPHVLALLALWMLAFHFVDLYYMIMPHVPAEAIHEAGSYPAFVRMVADGSADVGFHPGLVNITLPLGMMALAVAFTVRRLGNVALIPRQDPRLGESLAFENM